MACILTAEKGKENELKEKREQMESREEGITVTGDQGKRGSREGVSRE